MRWWIQSTRQQNKSTPNGKCRSGCIASACTVPPEFFSLKYSNVTRKVVSVLPWQRVFQPCALSLYARLKKDLSLRSPHYFLLSAERGFTISLQSRSPLSSAVMITSAVAILVATGTLYTSHIRSSSWLTVSLDESGRVSLK